MDIWKHKNKNLEEKDIFIKDKGNILRKEKLNTVFTA